MALADIAWRPPTLKTPRLVLRGYEPEDAPAIYQYGANPDVTEFVAFPRHQSVDDAVAFLDTMVAKHYAEEQLDYAITLADDSGDTVIGGVAAFWRSRKHQVMELGYILDKPHWGNGYVVEAARALMQYAFDTTEAFRIEAPVFTVNERSRRAATKMGMTFEGVLRSWFNQHGTRRDLAIYSVLRREI